MAPLLTLLLMPLAQFPPPQSVAVTDVLKCDWGSVVSVSSTERPTVVIQSSVGPVTYQVSTDTPVLGADHQLRGTVTSLKLGTRVRVYFVIDNGARVLEIDLQD